MKEMSDFSQRLVMTGFWSLSMEKLRFVWVGCLEVSVMTSGTIVMPQSSVSNWDFPHMVSWYGNDIFMAFR